MLEFQWPWMLAALPLPLLVYWLIPAQEKKPVALYAPSFIRGLDSQTEQKSASIIRTILLSLVWISLVIAASRPVYLGDPVELPAKGRDLMLAVDLSGSMKETDMLIGQEYYRRIDALKYVLGDFIDKRKGDRLGLIVFGTNAYLHAPITYDRQTIKQFLQEARIGFAGDRTSIGDAIGLAVKKLRNRPEESRVLILVTDGANTAGAIDPLKAADIAADAGIKIYTIGMGASQVIQRTLFGNRIVNPSKDLDEETLKSIAGSTGGKYFRAHTPEELQSVYQTINKLEPVDQDARTVRPSDSLFHLPLGIGLFFSLSLAFIVKALPQHQGVA